MPAPTNLCDAIALLHEERWLPVIGHEDRYEVSDLGRVRPIRRGKSAATVLRAKRGPLPALRPSTSKSGRKRLTLKRNGVVSYRFVHRLVLEAFVGPCPESMEACHWDGRAENNRFSNLRWDTHQANLEDDHRNGVKRSPEGERHYAAKLWPDAVRAIRAEPHYPGVLAMLARAFDVRPGVIYAVRSGKTWKSIEQLI